MKNKVDFFGGENKLGLFIISRFAIQDMGMDYLRGISECDVSIIHQYEDLSIDRLKILFTSPEIPEVLPGEPIPVYALVKYTGSPDDYGKYASGFRLVSRGHSKLNPWEFARAMGC